MKRILVCLDRSARQSFVLREAISLAEQAHAELVLLHVVEPTPGLTPLERGRDPSIHAKAEGERRRLAELSRFVPDARLHAFKVSIGEPWRVICRTARDYAVSYVVVGCEGVRVDDPASSTTAESVVRHCDRSVIVLRPAPGE